MKEIYTKTKGYRIRMARKTRGLTQVQLAKEVQTTQQTIHDYERNKRGSYADTNLLINISNICEVSIDWILTGKAFLNGHLNIPILNSAEDLLAWLKQNKSAFYKSKQQVGFYLGDNSMVAQSSYSDSFKPKDIIIVSGAKSAVANDYVIATTPFKNTPILFRKLLLEKNKYLLKPLNEQYPIIQLEHPIKIIGIALEQRRLFSK